MNVISLAVQCNSCGNWRATDTTNLQTAQFTCFKCGKTMKIRNDKGWNVNYKIPTTKNLNELVASLNQITAISSENR